MDDYLEVATLWQEADQRPRAEAALTAGGRRCGQPRFFVPRMNMAGRYQDMPTVQAVGR